jgi:hypothetical protein
MTGDPIFEAFQLISIAPFGDEGRARVVRSSSFAMGESLAPAMDHPTQSNSRNLQSSMQM